MLSIYLPPQMMGLAGTGWSIIDSILYCGFEDYGKTYKLPESYNIPPTGYVGDWSF